MFPNMQGYMKAKYGNLPSRKLSEPEFIKLCLENGMTEEKAKQTATINKIMGSEVMLGEEMVSITE